MLEPSFILRDLSQLTNAAKWLLKAVEQNKLLAFYGELGAGKTTLIQELCKQLGVNQNVTSPTFALVNEYTVSGIQTIFHFDFYRLNKPEEALDIGFEDYVSSGNYCFMEWPERIEIYLTSDVIRIYIDVQADNSRLISLVSPA